MKTFELHPNDMPIITTLEQEKEIVELTLSLFDGDYATLLTGLSRTFNGEAEYIKSVTQKIKDLRDYCGDINNERVSEWQRQHNEYKSIDSDIKRI